MLIKITNILLLEEFKDEFDAIVIATGWIMSRTPIIDAEEYKNMVRIIKDSDYDITKIKLIPQQALRDRKK